MLSMKERSEKGLAVLRGRFEAKKKIAIKLLKEGLSINEISKRLKCSRTLLTKELKEEGIIPKKLLNRCKYNEDFFQEINNESNAYFLGLFYADAYVNTKNNNVEITLKDLELIKKINKYIANNTCKISIKTAMGGTYYRIFICNQTIVKDLIRHGCHQKKSLTLKAPNIDRQLIRHFIRGYLDGDGCIDINFSKRRFGISFIGTLDVLNYIRNYTFEIMGSKGSITKRDISNCYCLRYGGRINTYKILFWLYKDSTIHMERKYQKYKSIVDFTSNMLKNKNILHNDPLRRITY